MCSGRPNDGIPVYIVRSGEGGSLAGGRRLRRRRGVGHLVLMYLLFMLVLFVVGSLVGGIWEGVLWALGVAGLLVLFAVWLHAVRRRLLV